MELFRYACTAYFRPYLLDLIQLPKHLRAFLHSYESNAGVAVVPTVTESLKDIVEMQFVG